MNAAQAGWHHAVLVKESEKAPALARRIGKLGEPCGADIFTDPAMHISKAVGTQVFEQSGVDDCAERVAVDKHGKSA
jgi:hypothetical protein